ncbi:Iba57p [Saccharomyces cerevisiae x Saccharomyces kudriavzevii VIN7]|uniref:Iba57p n=1 Tax=Saccharomyces cerevisiae x Saccharomyces kudriavzevii (strain VIN7) TaxID=1095631 RepID=H0GX57_SACCK|nr:Iba57p [Saccharomyces cerevisiae x Saccharomyces kudriavzevii VIN7]
MFVIARCRNKRLTLKSLSWVKPSTFRFVSTESLSVNAATRPDGVFNYSSQNNRAYIKIRGPDTVKFLNGLITSKLLPHFVKKNLTTVEDSQIFPGTTKVGPIVPVPEFDARLGNWGLYNETGIQGPYISRFGLYSAFLNGKGKLITDTVIYPTPVLLTEGTPNYPEYILEFHENVVDKILHVLQAHKLASRIKFEKIGNTSVRNWNIEIGFPNLPKDMENPWFDNLLDPMALSKSSADANNFSANVIESLFNSDSRILGIYVERRTELMSRHDSTFPQSFRLVTSQQVEDPSKLFNFQVFEFPFQVNRMDPTETRQMRFRKGLVDSTQDYKPETLLPLELNFDLLPNTISTNKGCYVGQELTARTYATGILRKRLVPVKLDNHELLNNEPEKNYAEIHLSSTTEKDHEQLEPAPNPFVNERPVLSRRKQRPAGSLIANEGQYGVALLRIEHFPAAFSSHELVEFYIATTKGENVKVTPQRPFWFEDWKQNYNLHI